MDSVLQTFRKEQKKGWGGALAEANPAVPGTAVEEGS